ncbi:D-ribose pyranase [Lapillicoccus sp.]|uniref:D-ribose pyranase n=1 Tax=Lapillicoccus sp. TaxID=1909287 RepID=UPI0025D678AC|nr:D-ribose pyranase [Lapillicoccus sp.]
MLRHGILNARLAGGLARLGHTHQIVIADAGLPLPYGVRGCRIVDLALVAGIPRFEQVLDAILDVVVVERAEAALESRSHPSHGWIAARLDTLSLISHEALKSRLPQTQLVVRTGESTPYANVILHCGVPF